jgi:hypothetical protein
VAYNYRGRRVNNDNISAGNAAGWERVISGSSQVSMVSLYGNPRETGGFTNISAGQRPGIEDTQSEAGSGVEKITSNGEDVAN